MPPRVHTILVVDDSAFMRKLIVEMLSTAPEFRVVGVARNGVEALEQIVALQPDLLTLDLEMPQLDGLQVLQQVMARAPRPVVVLSAGGAQFGAATMRALELGAVDVVMKPSGAVSLDLPVIRERLLDALRAAVASDTRKVQPRHPVTVQRPDGQERIVPHPAATQVVVIAASTGGPLALAKIIPRFPVISAAVLVAQHMPREFTPSLAGWLNRASVLPVTEAVDGEPVQGGRVYIAPGRSHIRVAGEGGGAVVALEPTPVDAGGVAPSADELFLSAARIFGPRVVGVVLTGMGRDGAEGARAIRAAGGEVLVQDRGTAVVYGMPRAVLTGGGADRVVALDDMAPAILEALVRERFQTPPTLGELRV